MATPDRLNPAITDTVTQTNVKVVAEAPAIAMGSLYQVVSSSVAMVATNAVFAQQQANISYQASSSVGVAKLLNITHE